MSMWKSTSLKQVTRDTSGENIADNPALAMDGQLK